MSYEGNNECSICLETIVDKSILSCGHTFHNICILKYFMTIDILKCPNCRKFVYLKANNYNIYNLEFVKSIILYSTIYLPKVLYSFYTLYKLLNRRLSLRS